MKYIVLAKKKLAIYDSIDELPIINYQKFNKYCIFDSNVGSNLDDIQQHINAVMKLVDRDVAKAKTELQNMLMGLSMIVSEISPKYLAFAALIHSIDGKEVKDYSDENLKRIIASLQTEKHNILLELFESLKKKFRMKCKLTFQE